MSIRGLTTALLVLLVGVNTWCGVAKVQAFRHRLAGTRALESAELDLAYASFHRAIAWQGTDAQSHVLIGRVIKLAQANGLPLEALEGRQPIEVLGVGLAAIARGIALNPADAWGWFNVADLYQGFRAGRLRLEAMKRAGEEARLRISGQAVPPSPPAEAAPPADLGLEDAITLAAAMKSLELEPDYFFHHDFLADIFLDRGFEDQASHHIRESMAIWPRVEAHAVLEHPEFLRKLATPILEGIDRSTSSAYAGPVMAAHARGIVLERLGRFEEAIAAFEELRRIGDETITAACDLELGILEQRRGRDAESLPYLERAVQTAPESSSGIWALYYMGGAWSRQGDHVKAIDLFRRHLELAPDTLDGYLSLGGELELTGQSAEAERVYISAVRRFPEIPYTYVLVIGHLRRHGKTRQALLYAEGLLKVSPDREEAERLIFELSEEATPRAP